jgi:RNA polymerase sigma-70 factor (ECF subfamily)
MNDRRALTPHEERDLMQRLATGDEAAVRTVYERFARPVYTLGLRMLGSTQSAEDLTQDVFLAAWRKASRYDPSRGRLSTWLMTIAHNTAVDRIRRDAARPQRSGIPLEEAPQPAVVEEDSVVDRMTALRALATLTVAERKLLELAYFRGWTAREIAEHDRIPLGTVKTRIRATLIKLRRTQKPEEE